MYTKICNWLKSNKNKFIGKLFFHLVFLSVILLNVIPTSSFNFSYPYHLSYRMEYLILTIVAYVFLLVYKKKKYSFFPLVILLLFTVSYIMSDYKAYYYLDIDTNVSLDYTVYFTVFENFDNVYPQRNVYGYLFESIMEFIGVEAMLLMLFFIIDNFYYPFKDKVGELQKSLDMYKKQLLNQQFNPHFLFNALNTVYSLSLDNNPNTSNVVLKISNMMRYLIDDVNSGRVLLIREIDFINEFLDIQKVRYGEKANICFDIQDNNYEIPIEPMILVTLVENAFKHCFMTNSKESFVRINLSLDNKILFFKVVNYIAQDISESKRNGLGLDNLKNRLNLAYPKRYSLSLNKGNSEFVAILSIKLN
ncbi:hypothetical protein E0494_06565 [Marinilabiliaceae bacterium JC040]|nr:hypothetical protein [Marinilabiliaceae bacterium JC040]